MIEGCMICSGDLLWLLLGLYTVPCEYMYIYICIHLMPFGGGHKFELCRICNDKKGYCGNYRDARGKGFGGFCGFGG